ncbi:MAG: sel1 repeat family protein [Magnetococcus sp. DMHC-8]
MNTITPIPDSPETGALLKQMAQPGMHAFSEEDYYQALLTMAEWGDAKAQHNLGALFLEGIEIQQDYTEAFRWHSLAAAQGMALAQHDLASMYLEGLGTPEDPEKAAYWFDLAARQGDSKAQNNLGILYATGHGLPMDLVQAYQWFTRAAAGGMLDALDNREMAEQEMSAEQLAVARQWLATQP